MSLLTKLVAGFFNIPFRGPAFLLEPPSATVLFSSESLLALADCCLKNNVRFVYGEASDEAGDGVLVGLLTLFTKLAGSSELSEPRRLTGVLGCTSVAFD